ncbi:hypothetical protein [Neotamlana nanhaiensis]|uniref:hypothetical protein n=1 Tax=Neotamlana nanhaiensis TaxID=1382798 RepID=UPI0012FEDC54|nr:hypothetical protein [Tamlana nanhaiensis]
MKIKKIETNGSYAPHECKPPRISSKLGTFKKTENSIIFNIARVATYEIYQKTVKQKENKIFNCCVLVFSIK